MDRDSQKRPQKKSKKTQDGNGLALICGLIAAAVAVLLVVFAVRGLTRPAGSHDGTAGEEAAAESGGAAEAAGDEEAGGTAAGDQKISGAEAIEDPVYADITVEGYGTITVAMDAAAAPATVRNFTALAEEGFYDGLTFHRIIDGFMMQGGDPEGTGLGGADETITGEFAANGYDNPLSHTRGAISMARSQDYNSASSQFFIVQSDSTYLDGQYAAFGYVTSGMEYVDQICKDAKPTDGNGSIAKEDQPVITSIVIRQE